MRSRPRRARAWDAGHDRRIGKSRRPLGARSAELLYRQDGAAAEPRSADAGARALCQRHGAAAHGACGVPALAACACEDHRHRCRRGQAHARRHRRRDRRGTCRRHHALGRRALASEGTQIGAAARHRDRSRLLAGRSRRRHRGDQPRRRRGRRGSRRGRIRGTGGGDGHAHRARFRNPGHSSCARRQPRLRAQPRCRRGRCGVCRLRRGGGSGFHLRPAHRRDAGAARGGGRLERRRGAADDLPGHAGAAHGAEHRGAASGPCRSRRFAWSARMSAAPSASRSTSTPTRWRPMRCRNCCAGRSSSSPTGSKASTPISMPATIAARAGSASSATAPSPRSRSTISPASVPIRCIRAPAPSRPTRSSIWSAVPIRRRTTARGPASCSRTRT